jgi:hypothetical protein
MSYNHSGNHYSASGREKTKSGGDYSDTDEIEHNFSLDEAHTEVGR